jgi:hypothetical protein
MIGMLAPVNLHDQPRSQTHEIRDILPNRHLATKSIAAHAPLTQVVPKTPFGVRRIRAQSACVCGQ